MYVAITSEQCCVCGYYRWTVLCMCLSQVDSDVYVAITDGQCCVCLSRVDSVVCGYHRWTVLCVVITGGQGYV